ncbi:putative gustatory receptor 28a [Condylostylus longicornis]|uniref:putative gustatory receptor 28a n=1 Tax=Condylostylus longicornis TaxID=2530218 RepID=UPI00244DC135|nr:putative gustatory receptor 28a [Condylostylus longicornis]
MSSINLETIFNADNVYSAVKPISVCTYIGGLGPILPNNDNFATKIIGYIFSILHIAVYFTCCAISIYQKQTVVGYFFHNSVTRIGDFLQGICGILIMCILFINKKILHYSYLITFIIFIFNFLYYFGCFYLLKFTGINPSFEVYSTFVMPYIHMALVLVKFKSYMKLIAFRISMLNQNAKGNSSIYNFGTSMKLVVYIM